MAVASPWLRRVVRALQALVAVGLAAAVFGLCVPFTLIDLRVIPPRGLANVVYVLAGAAVGVAVGALGAARTLREDALFPRRYVAFVAAMAAAVGAALLAARYLGAFAHV